MALYTEVRPSKRRFSKGHWENGLWVSDRQIQEHRDFVQLQRYKQKAIVDMMPEFFTQYEDILNEICSLVRENLEEKLAELILERAYATGANEEYWDSNQIPTFQFANAWEVDVYVGQRGTLHFDPIYHYQSLDIAHPRDRGYNLHAGFKGQDMRLALGDILNEPFTFSGGDDSWYRKRIGRWYEKFMEYCRTTGVQMFKDLCRAYGILS